MAKRAPLRVDLENQTSNIPLPESSLTSSYRNKVLLSMIFLSMRRSTFTLYARDWLAVLRENLPTIAVDEVRPIVELHDLPSHRGIAHVRRARRPRQSKVGRRG